MHILYSLEKHTFRAWCSAFEVELLASLSCRFTYSIETIACLDKVRSTLDSTVLKSIGAVLLV
jgi:hypothetical protein